MVAVPCALWIVCAPVRRGFVAGRSTRSLERTKMASETPLQVSRAVRLLWLSLGLATLSTIAEWPLMTPEDRAFELWIGITVAVVTVLQAALIFFASRRRNWARISLLVVLLLGAATFVFFPGEDEPWWYWMSVVSSFVLDGIAIFWLFSGVAAEWFRVSESAEGAL
jgi:hypothetical protein